MPRPNTSKINYPFLDHSSPGKPLASSSPPGSVPWYKLSAQESSIDESDAADQRLDLLSAASTPLHVSHIKPVLFTSPLKKLDDLHLSQAKHVRSTGHNHDDSDDSDSPNFDAGNQTIAGSPYSSSGGSDSTNDTDMLAESAKPKFIRKRKHTESPIAMDLTSSFHPEDKTIPHNTTNDMSVFCGNETTDSILKASFSASDSTPCPVPRKKMKLVQTSFEHTPSQPSKLSSSVLDFNGSRKISASSAPLLSKLNDATEKENGSPKSSFMSPQFSHKAVNSTPISSSTPANSRSASPETYKEVSDEEVNGYKFIKPSSKFQYQTPQSRSTNDAPYYHSVKSYTKAFNSNKFEDLPRKYEIVGDFPVSAAGLMDEEDTSVHFADKRINDPYLGPSNKTPDTSELLENYLRSTNKLPLQAHFERELSNSDMNTLLSDGVSVMRFYDTIVNAEDKLAFLKKERLRWHPDKWVSRIEDSIFDKSNIDSVSQAINTLISDLSDRSRGTWS